jgi:hypothetical protein
MAHQRRTGVELVWQLERFLTRRLQRRVLTQDRVLETAQLRPRLDPDRFNERSPSIAIGLEGVGLSTRAVQRQHALRM